MKESHCRDDALDMCEYMALYPAGARLCWETHSGGQLKTWVARPTAELSRSRTSWSSGFNLRCQISTRVIRESGIRSKKKIFRVVFLKPIQREIEDCHSSWTVEGEKRIGIELNGEMAEPRTRHMTTGRFRPSLNMVGSKQNIQKCTTETY